MNRWPLAVPAAMTKPAVRPVGGGRHRGGTWPAPRPRPACRRNGDHRWTTGDQPPDMATQSQAICSVRRPRPPARRADAGDALAALHRWPMPLFVSDADAERPDLLRQRALRLGRARR